MSNWNQIARNAALATPKPKRKTRKRKSASPKIVVSQKANGFYATREWAEIRYQALKLSDGKCQLCGRGKSDGALLQVDHIKPRSKYPKLALTLSNLQVLCSLCNWGKSNKDDTDWRDEKPLHDEWAAIRERMGEA